MSFRNPGRVAVCVFYHGSSRVHHTPCQECVPWVLSVLDNRTYALEPSAHCSLITKVAGILREPGRELPVASGGEGSCGRPPLVSVPKFFLSLGLGVVTPGHRQYILIRLEAAPGAVVSPSEPEFPDLRTFHLVSRISLSRLPPNKKIKSWPSLAFLCS